VSLEHDGLQKQTTQLERLPSIEDRGQTDRPRQCVTTPTRAGLRRCLWPRPRHAARLDALARSWWRDSKKVQLRPSVNTQIQS